jgi:N-acyl-D-amino-acid deacylase
MRVAILLVLLLTACLQSPSYDLVIRRGTLYDGSGQPPRVADIAVNGDTIAAIGELDGSAGRQEIGARGLAVAPGFVNMLSWANESLLII